MQGCLGIKMLSCRVFGWVWQGAQHSSVHQLWLPGCHDPQPPSSPSVGPGTSLPPGGTTQLTAPRWVPRSES